LPKRVLGTIYCIYPIRPKEENLKAV